jgi:hypothetical protein
MKEKIIQSINTQIELLNIFLQDSWREIVDYTMSVSALAFNSLCSNYTIPIKSIGENQYSLCPSLIGLQLGLGLVIIALVLYTKKEKYIFVKNL